ncbi:MAG: glycosyltransferase [Bacteriovoracaceae bacterium]|nr:glycosyltransferase [Bacteriovoracaceae bacterium]
MKKISILQIVQAPEGGIRKHILDILKYLPPEKYELFLLTDIAKGDEPFHDFLKAHQNIHVKFLNMSMPKKPSLLDFINFFKIYFLVRKYKIQIYHGHGAKGGLYARVLGFFMRKKVIYTPHGGSLHQVHGVMGFVYFMVEKILSYFTDLFIFESLYSLNQFQKNIGAPEKKIFLNYNGIEFIEEKLQKECAQDEVPIIAAFGLWRFLKGYDVLIRAAELLKAQGLCFKVKIYGKGEEHQNYRQIIADLALEDRVELCLQFGVVEAFMKKAQVVVIPSRHESFGYVAIEAMALGIPVIASNIGGLKEIIQDGQNGFLVPVGNAEILAEKIAQLLHSSVLKEQFQQAGIRTVTEKFSLASMIKKLDESYEKILFPLER